MKSRRKRQRRQRCSPFTKRAKHTRIIFYGPCQHEEVWKPWKSCTKQKEEEKVNRTNGRAATKPAAEMGHAVEK